MNTFNLFNRYLVVFLSVLLASCQSMNGTVGGYLGLDTDLQIDFIVDADINPDDLGKPSPLFIRMYELKDRKMLKKADFISLYERDKEMLGADLVNTHRLRRFTPGENRTEHFVLDGKSNYVALYAEFLDFKQSRFKLLIPVVANNVVRNSVVVRVSGNQVRLDTPVEEALLDDDGTRATSADTAGRIKAASEKTRKYF